MLQHVTILKKEAICFINKHLGLICSVFLVTKLLPISLHRELCHEHIVSTQKVLITNPTPTTNCIINE